MNTTRRNFLQASALASLAAVEHIVPVAAEKPPDSDARNAPLNGFAIAKRHTIRRDIPGPTFMEGMLLGNGDVGVCAVVRPDALGIHIGKNDCWDIRVSQVDDSKVLPFADLLALWRRAGEEAKKQGKPDMVHLEENIDFFREYVNTVDYSYEKKWPRPWPCGTLWINWDLRRVTPLQYQLDPSNGMFTLELQSVTKEERPATVLLSAFVDWQSGLVSLGSDKALEVLSVVFSPEVDGLRVDPFGVTGSAERTGLLPQPHVKVDAGTSSAQISCFQSLPATGPTAQNPSPSPSVMDRNYSLLLKAEGSWSSATPQLATDISLVPRATQPLSLNALVVTPRDILLSRLQAEADAAGSSEAAISIPQTHVYTDAELNTPGFAREQMDKLTKVGFATRQSQSEQHWRAYWSLSAVQLDNPDLERIWYHNQYFLACCLKKNKVAPGLFANWSAGDIGTAWHGDYHADYNCQQVYWSVFSSNHHDMHFPYLELCENLRAMAEKFAHDKFNLPGACFPLSSYPVPNQSIPYPVPPWAYQVSMTPWTVQSFWWHYLYTQDEDELRRAYPLLRAAAQFVSAYLKKESDGKYHVIPTVSSENWGFTVDFRLNKDCILDLALSQFLFDAVVNASRILGQDASEREQWMEIGQNLASYPTVQSTYGEVWADIENAPPDWIYNVPITLAPVFPGEQVGLDKAISLDLARRTAEGVRLEGGNAIWSFSP